MASSSRSTRQSIELRAELAENPYRFDFFQALRLIDAVSNDLPRLGHAARPIHESIRLGHEPSLAFATSSLSSFVPGDAEKKDELEVRFFGLFGPNGPMPLHLTEYVRDRQRQENDATFKAFTDIFHHRMLSLLYRAWASARPTASFDRPSEDLFFNYVASLIGIGTPAALEQDSLADHTRVYFAGLLGMHNRPAPALGALVEDYLQVSTEVEEFVGEWLELPENTRFMLGRSADCSTLGVNATAGRYVWHCQGKFRLVCGPMSISDFNRLLPDGNSLPALVSLVKHYAGAELEWELRLVLKASDVPACKLGEQGALGWTSWLGQRQIDEDATEVLLHPSMIA